MQGEVSLWQMTVSCGSSGAHESCREDYAMRHKRLGDRLGVVYGQAFDRVRYCTDDAPANTLLQRETKCYRRVSKLFAEHASIKSLISYAYPHSKTLRAVPHN